MRRNCLEFDFWFKLGEQLIINRIKLDWETLNTSKIKTVFYSSDYGANDYGARIRFQCHKPIQRKTKTLEAELCTNWNFMDSFGVRYHTDGYKKFYDDPSEWWDQSDYSGSELLYDFHLRKNRHKSLDT